MLPAPEKDDAPEVPCDKLYRHLFAATKNLLRTNDLIVRACVEVPGFETWLSKQYKSEPAPSK